VSARPRLRAVWLGDAVPVRGVARVVGPAFVRVMWDDRSFGFYAPADPLVWLDSHAKEARS
jgi:hypothetical protein